MKRLAIALAIGASLLAPVAAQAAQPVIGLAMAQEDTFLTLLKDGVVSAAQKDGAKLEIEDAQGDVGRQLNQIQNLIANKVSAIIVNPVDTDVTPKITKMVAAAHIPLVYVNRKPVDLNQLPPDDAFVASDEKVSGTLETEAVCKLLHGKGKILVLMGDLSQEAARQRTKDIENVIKTPACSGMKIIDKREAKWDRTKAENIVLNWMSTGMQFNAIIANNDEMALGAINGLKAAHKWTPSTIVSGIDATPDGLASMKAGELKVTVFQNAKGQGAGAMDAAIKLIHHQHVDRFVNVPFQLVTPANLNQYLHKN